MKKLLLLSLFLTAFLKLGFGQCTPLPATGNPGFYPPADSFPCATRGEPFFGIIYFENFDSTFVVTGIPLTLHSLVIDSMTGLPSGFSYSILPDNSFLPGESGCMNIFGTTNDTAGIDSLYVYVTATLDLVGSLSNEIGVMANQVAPGTFNRFYINVIESGSPCANSNISFTNLITGSVFYDANNNGNFDSTESKMTNIPVEISPGQITGFTAQDGSYYVFADTGNYTVSIAPPANYVVSGVDSYAVTSSGVFQTYSGNDFGLYPTVLIDDLRVTLTSGFARPGFITNHWIHYQNIGTSIQSGTISYHYDPVLNFISVSETPASQNANNITWNFANLFPSQQRSIRIQLQVPANNNLLGDTLLSLVNLPLPRDTNLLNNKDTAAQIVTGSYDPNDKQVSPDDAKNGVHPSQPLTYTIRFQNTGSDTAFKIVVRDTLDDFLDASSFRTVAASHPCAFQLEGGKYAIWTFDNILLPDSGIDEPSSHGFVKFSISIKSNAPDQSVIENTASIYFDFNLPVRTNTTQARVELTSGIYPPDVLHSVAFPNPVSETLTIVLSKNRVEFDLLLFDISGRIIETFHHISGNKIQIGTKDFENGIYFYQLLSDSYVFSRGKFSVLR